LKSTRHLADLTETRTMHLSFRAIGTCLTDAWSRAIAVLLSLVHAILHGLMACGRCLAHPGTYFGHDQTDSEHDQTDSELPVSSPTDEPHEAPSSRESSIRVGRVTRPSTPSSPLPLVGANDPSVLQGIGGSFSSVSPSNCQDQNEVDT